jgi:hypothetical protein
MTEHLIDRTQVRSVLPYTNASLQGNLIRLIMIVIVNCRASAEHD